MSNKVTQIEELKLHGTDLGKISIFTVAEPYGEGSDTVASIGIYLQGDSEEPEWKVHIPKENIDDLISALKKAKETM